ncbi:hypothetical protein FHL15_007765 [Xylaria flabelliformis]|uniref:Uncharacterized protein n=1 Tax=Xylaria flabelliformis TaxID=2512241 RepID=A0A553HTR1_9PEZI|nr:hypothetical protein FHL15_007765 [Xylaria flabelliformis]
MESLNALITRGKSIIATRDLSDSDSSWDSAINATISLLGIALFGLALVGTLMLLQRHRRQQQLQDQTLPRYNDLEYGAGQTTRRLTIQTPEGKSSIVVVNGRPMLADPNAPPHSPTNVPQIHITFPDEHDEQGRRKNGRVLLVRVGETTIGLEPLKEEQLPAYDKEGSNSFYSIDMDRIGGLKEKDRSQFA